jgi:RNA polymerase sigma-70 factor (ECF subfamily)
LDVNDETIWQDHKSDLIRYATVLVGGAEAEDVVSSVVVRILERRSLSDFEDPRAYLFRAVLNESRSRKRRMRTHERVMQLVPPVPDVEQAQPSPEVYAAVAGLPAQQRAATYLVYWLDMSIADAARTMGVRAGTVKRYIHLARKTLEGILDAH